MSGLLFLPVALGFPLLLAGLTLLPAVRRHALDLIVLAPLPGLAAALLAPRGEMFLLPEFLLGMRLELTGSGAIFLTGAAILWFGAAIHARTALAGEEKAASFALFWNLALSGMYAVILAADAVSFYAGFALVSLISWPLIVHRRSRHARRAGTVYITLAVLGEVALLAGLILAVSAAGGALEIAAIRDALAQAEDGGLILALFVIAFGIKAALIPAHVWAPLAYRAAPVPAAAVLSGSIAKAGVIGLLAFLPLDAAPQPPGGWLAALGFIGTFAAALIGLAQTHPKTVLAYSSISQLGLMTGTVGLALAAGMKAEAVIMATAVYAIHHGLAKGALFLVVGAVAKTGGDAARRLKWVAAAAAFSIAGFPLTGGAVAKLALKHEMSLLMQYVVIGSAITTTLVLLRFLAVLAPASPARARAPLTLSVPVAGLTAAALALPWMLTADLPIAPDYAWHAGNLVNALWPVLTALVIFRIARGLKGPAIPASDLLVPVLKGFGAIRRRLGDVSRPQAPSVPGAPEGLRTRAAGFLARLEEGFAAALPGLLLLAALLFALTLVLAA